MKKVATVLFLLMIILPSTVMAEGALMAQYAPGNSKYEDALGLGIYELKDERIGIYVNLQASGVYGREPYYESLTTTSFGDPITNTYNDIAVLNLGITKRAISQVYAYVGLGYAVLAGTVEKYDPYHILASDGYYYVGDPANTDSGINVNVGLLFNINRLTAELGYNSFFSNIYFGIGINF